MCLAHLLYTLDQDLVLAHMHYGLRGADSDRDASLVETWARKHHLPFHLKTVDPQTLCLPGESLQMAARRERYSWLESLRTTLPNATVVTAHHLDDAIETFFQNALRGSGIKGLTGIKNQVPQLLRPLSKVSRTVLLEYARKHEISWREDLSNQSAKYDRNYLRLEVLPVLERRFPAYRAGFQKVLSHLEESHALQNWATGQWKAKLWKEQEQGVTIETTPLQGLPFARLLLVEWLLPFGFHPDQCGQMLEAAQSSTFESEHWILYKGSDTLELRRRVFLDTSSLELPIEEGFYPTPEGPVLEIRWLDRRPSGFSKDLNQCLIDKAWLQNTRTLTLHHWQKGDRIQPFGMKGQHQKIHDVLTNAKVPAYAKTLRVVSIRGEIIWVPGLKRSIHGTLLPETSEALWLLWHPG